MTTLYDVVVRGRLALPGGVEADGAVAVRAGRIVAILGPDEPYATHQEYHAPWVLPGAIDAHMHTRSSPSEGIGVATAFAAAGGVTTVLDMPYDWGRPVNSAERFRDKQASVAEQALVDVGLWATIAPDGELDQIAQMAALGACGYKVSLFDTDPDRFPQIPDGFLLDVMQEIACAGRPVAVHCENTAIVKHRLAALRASGRTDPGVHGDSRPPVAETEAIGRALELAHYAGARVHIVHVSVARGLEQVRRHALAGDPATAETCLHYLLLDDRDMAEKGSICKINPPLRSRQERDALWCRVADGGATIITSDHVAWPEENKRGATVFDAHSGVPGVGVLLPLLFHELVTVRGLPVSLLVDLLAGGPARLFGLANKGAIRVGADADLALVDPGATWQIHGPDLAHPCGWSPYEGRVAAMVCQVFLRGALVADHGRPTAQPGTGQFVGVPR